MYLTVLKANIYKYFINLMRAYPISFFVSSFLTITYSLLFSYLLYHDIFKRELSQSFVEYTNTSNYMGYILVGAFTYSFAVSTLLNVSRTLITERRMGTLESIMLAPFSRMVYFFSHMIAQTIQTIGELGIAIPLLYIFGISFSKFNIAGFVLVFALSMFALLGLSILLANVMLYTRDTFISQNTLFTFMFLICGVNFPIEYLPNWVQNIAILIPLTQITELFRATVFENDILANHYQAIICLVLQSILYITIGFLLLKRIEKLALEQIDG